MSIKTAYARLTARAERDWFTYVALRTLPGIVGVLLGHLLFSLAGNGWEPGYLLTFVLVWTIVTTAIASYQFRANRNRHSPSA